MAILSTNTRLVKAGQDYSAGENIGIYDHTISSRNWTPDITYAAESAFQRANEYTNTQISGLSGEVSSEVSQLGSDIDYISGVALTSHQSLDGYLTKASGDEYYQPIGSYATVSQLESTSSEIVNLIPTDYVSNETLEQTSGDIVNLIPDTSEFITNASAEATYQPIGNYATQDWVENKGYLTEVSIPESATWNDVSTTVQTNSATWGQGGGKGGDTEVNSFVYNNSANILDVDISYKTNSGLFLTAAPADMATTGDVAELAQTISETYQVKGDYLVRSDSANFYPANNPSSFAREDWVTAQGYITGVDLSEYAKRTDVLSSIESATSGKLDVSSFASVSGDFLTNEDLNGYATESFVENVSGDITDLIPTDYYPDNNPSAFVTENWVTGQGYITGIPESALSGLIPYSASGIELPNSNFKIDVSGQAYKVSSYNESKTIIGNYGGDYETWFPLSSLERRVYSSTLPPGDFDCGEYMVYPNDGDAYFIPLNGMVDLTKISQEDWDNSTILSINAANRAEAILSYSDTNNVEIPYQTIEGMTAYQPVGDYATTSEVDTLSSMLSGAIDYVSANAGDEFPVSADEAIQYVENNSATINDVNTSYQTNSGTFLTAHQAISANEWNDCYDNVNTNSGVWGGSALPISAGPGISLSMVDGVLVISLA